MKKVALFILCSVCVILMNSCGNSTKEQNAEKVVEAMDLPQDGIHGYAGKAGEELKNVTSDNYIDISKTLFGIDVTPQAGWTLKSTKSPNKVNNLNIIYDMGSADADSETAAKEYFDQCLAVATDGVYAVDLDLNTGAISRGDKFTDYASYKAQSDGMNTWSYDYNGLTIQFSISSWKSQLELAFVLTTK